MACIKSAPRSANLEIFKLDFQSDTPELPVVGACPSSKRFSRLSWGKPGTASEEYSLGLVAGGLCDGRIGVWNPLKLISSDNPDSALVARHEKHAGPVGGLEFSAHSPNMLASGADEGELYILDLANPTEPNLFPPLMLFGTEGSRNQLQGLGCEKKTISPLREFAGHTRALETIGMFNQTSVWGCC